MSTSSRLNIRGKVAQCAKFASGRKVTLIREPGGASTPLVSRKRPSPFVLLSAKSRTTLRLKTKGPPWGGPLFKRARAFSLLNLALLQGERIEAQL